MHVVSVVCLHSLTQSSVLFLSFLHLVTEPHICCLQLLEKQQSAILQ